MGGIIPAAHTQPPGVGQRPGIAQRRPVLMRRPRAVKLDIALVLGVTQNLDQRPRIAGKPDQRPTGPQSAGERERLPMLDPLSAHRASPYAVTFYVEPSLKRAAAQAQVTS
jgi:hypothetical protein